MLFMMFVEVYDTQSAFRMLQSTSKSINFSTAEDSVMNASGISSILTA